MYPQNGRYRETPNSALSSSGFDLKRTLSGLVQGAGIMGQNIGSFFGEVGSIFGQEGRSQFAQQGAYAQGQRNQVARETYGFNRPAADVTLSERLARDAQARREVISPGLYGAGARVNPISGMAEGQDIVQDYWQEQYDRYVAGLQAEKDAVKAGYQPVLEGLQDDVGDLRRAAAALGIPFDEYMAQRRAIGAGVGDAEKMAGSVIPAVNGIYDDAEKEMKEIYDQVNVNMGPEVATQLVNRVSEFENVMEDVARTDESAIDLLHERSGQYAKAAAQAAYSNDMYAALDAETKINAALDFKIKETEEEIARQKKAMAAAIAAATDRFEASFEYGEPEFDKVVDETWNEYFEANNVPEHERAAFKQMYGEIISDPANSSSESAFRKGLTSSLNMKILAQLGVGQGHLELAAANPKLLNILQSQDLARLFQTGQTTALFKEMGIAQWDEATIARIRRDGSRNADSYIGMGSAEAKHLRNMYTQRNEVSANWDEIVSKFGPKIDEANVSRAPNGYTFPIVGGGKYTNSFGYVRSAAQRRAGKMAVHQGIDIMAKRGSHMVSPVSGTVVSMDYSNISGNYIKIRDAKGNIHFMGHMNALSRNLQAGSRVNAGTFVGTVGNTGNARDTSPHVHYEIRARNGNRINPYPWLRSTNA